MNYSLDADSVVIHLKLKLKQHHTGSCFSSGGLIVYLTDQINIYASNIEIIINIHALQ